MTEAKQRTRAANGRSSIYFGADGRWHGRVSMGADPATGKPIRRQVTAKTQSEVSRKVRLLEKDREEGRPVAGRASRQTVRAYLTAWIENREALGARYKTVVGYRVDAQHIFAAFGGVRLERLTVDDIERLWKQMSAVHADGKTRIGSISHVRRTLNAALSDAVKRGYILRNPVGLARAPKHPRTLIQPYTVEEVRRLLDAATGSRNSARWTMGAVLGLRQGEVLGLRWDDLDDQAGQLTVIRQLQRRTWQHGCPSTAPCGRKRGANCPQRHGGGLFASEPKSEAGRRTIALPTSVLVELLAHREAQNLEVAKSDFWDPGGWMFPNEIGLPTDAHRDYMDWRQLCFAAGVPVRRLHDLRHTSATMLLEAQVDLKAAGQVLGHGTIAQTAAYTHILSDRKVATARAMDAFVFGVPSR
jgi:integrase